MAKIENIHQQVTDAIIASLEAGVRPWSRTWTMTGTGRHLRENGQPYQGINTLILAMTGRPAGHWFTYKQAEALGAQVRRGEKSTAVVFFKPLQVADKENPDSTKTIPLLRTYNVFHQDQIDNLPAKYAQPAPVLAPVERDAEADRVFAATGAKINHGGDKAYYVPSADYVQMPHAEQFHDMTAYYGTLAHELVHWTGNKSRLDRKFGTAHGTKDYAREELVAEMGAAFICAALGLESEPRPDHASYLASWLAVLREDNKAIFAAAAAAQKAASFVLAFSEADEMQEAA